MIEQFNRIALFVGTCVLKWESASMRARVIQRFVTIAEKLKDYNNFNSLKAVIGGLQATPVYRLKKTWELVSSKRHKQLRELALLMSEESNFKAYRNILHQKRTLRTGSPVPIVPYLGVHLTDFAFLDYVSKEQKAKDSDMVKDSSAEVVKGGSTIRDFLEMQKTISYSFTSKPIVRYYLLNISYLTEDQSYEKSLELEPKKVKNAESNSQSLDELRVFSSEDPKAIASRLSELNRKLDSLYARMNRMSLSSSSSSKKESTRSAGVDSLWELQREATLLKRQLKRAETSADASTSQCARPAL